MIQKHQPVSLVRVVLAGLAATSLLTLSGCGDGSAPSSLLGAAGTNTPQTQVAANANALPARGKVRAAVAPAKAVFGMIWVDTTKGREYIYDGEQWVPHDQSVTEFYQSQIARVALSMVQTDVCTDGDPSYTPTGAHGGPGTSPAGHYVYQCSVCHKVGGRLVFDKNGPAYAAGKPAPTFDATAKTCSNIACHSMPANTFSYYFPGGDGDPVYNTVTIYATSGAAVTPSWYAAGSAACGACHGNPPLQGSNGSNVWHSGYHANQLPAGTYNQCQFCHPDASGTNGAGTTITNPSLHANGKIEVQAKFTSTCFGCH